MGRYSNVGNARHSEKMPFFEEGNYVCQVLDVKEVKARTGKEFFAAEFQILESDNPEMRPGTEAIWMANLQNDATAGNINNFVSSVAHCDPSDVNEEAVLAMLSTNNPARGRKVRVKVAVIKTQKGADFSLHTFDTYSENDGQPKLVPISANTVTVAASTNAPLSTVEEMKQSLWG